LATPKDERPKPGLRSIHEAREQRARGKYSRATPNLLIYCAVAIVVILLGYRFFAGRKVDAARNELLSKQRAVDKTLGAEWFPLRDNLEKITTDTAKNWSEAQAFVDPDAKKWDFRSLPGVYLRLRVAEARDVASVRKSSMDAVRDSFVGCLLREPNPGLARGDSDAGVFAEQPWNMRQAYKSTRILNDEWVAEVKAADDDLRLRVFEEQYRKAVETEIPLAIDLVRRAQFFILVLDEDTPEAKEKTDGGPITSEALQLVPHDARVRIVNLKTNKDIVAMNVRASGTAVSVAGSVTDPEALEGITRQVNNCSMARQVERAIGFEKNDKNDKNDKDEKPVEKK
jgi:hypothetical protein